MVWCKWTDHYDTELCALKPGHKAKLSEISQTPDICTIVSSCKHKMKLKCVGKQWNWNVREGYTRVTQGTQYLVWLSFMACVHVCISKRAIHYSERHLLVLISPARVESLMSCKTSIRVAQITGCLPLPFSHSWRIFMLISSALSLHSRVMLSTLAPRSSASRIVPNVLYCVPISWGMLIRLSWPGKLSSSCRVGGLPAVWSKNNAIYS